MTESENDRVIEQIGNDGRIALPQNWLVKNALKIGDFVTLAQTDQGILILPPSSMSAMEALDRIGEALKAEGITLEDMMETIEETRQELYDEMYGRREELAERNAPNDESDDDMEILTRIGDALKAKGIALEEMIESGREIRGELLKEWYRIDPGENE